MAKGRLRPLARLLVSLAVLTAGLVVTHANTPQAPMTQQLPVFRGTTNVVPVDVRVLDKNGKPVTDLTRADFTVFENGVPQRLDYFQTEGLAPATPDSDVSVRPSEASAALAPATRRLFLIYLGRGRLQDPTKGIDATLRFVRDRLLPQDQVAVMAWNRATDFSADKGRAATIIERFKARHEEIEHELALHFTGLFALYAGEEIPACIQDLIDDVFDPSSGAGARHVLPSATLENAKEDYRRTLNNAMTDARGIDTFRLINGRGFGATPSPVVPVFGTNFDDFVDLNRPTMQDVGNLYAGVDYLRFIEGEKHLVYVTEHGFTLPRTEYERDLASLASDARVALDTVQTGGVAGSGFSLRVLRELSEVTGGQSSTMQNAEAGFDRILNATDFGYLLGYSPTDTKANGGTRHIKVQVNRPGVTLAYRHDYVARPETSKYDPREALATTRLSEAAGYHGPVDDLGFTTKLVDVKEGADHFVDVELSVEVSRVKITPMPDGRLSATMNFAVLCGNADKKDVGQVWESKNIILPASRLDEIKATGLPVTLRVAVKQPPKYVKVIVYDYGSDLVGSTTKVMR
jgi:VWFA-related protein